MNKFSEIATFGKQHPDWQAPLICNPCEELNPDMENIQSFRILFIRQGTGILNMREKRVVFRAPVIYCFNETESFTAVDSRNLSAQAVYFHPWVINSAFNYENIRSRTDLNPTSYYDLFWLKPFLDRTLKFYGQLPVGPLSAQKAAKLMKFIINEYEEQPDPETWPCRGRSFLIELLFFLEQLYSLKEPNPIDVPPSNSPEVDRIVLYIHRNYQQKITIEELTEVFHINRTSLMDLFYAATGTTIHNYLINLRIQLAYFLIRDTPLPLSEIIERVGFSDLSHFSRTFRRLTGHTPSDYRQEFRLLSDFTPKYIL